MISFETIRLFSAEPAISAGPDAPPFRIPSAVRRSNFPCGDAPWQTTHLAFSSGSTSDENVGIFGARPPQLRGSKAGERWR